MQLSGGLGCKMGWFHLFGIGSSCGENVHSQPTSINNVSVTSRSAISVYQLRKLSN